MPEDAPAQQTAPASVATLASEIDIDGFRAAGRRLLAAGIPPHDVEWKVDGRAENGLALTGQLTGHRDVPDDESPDGTRSEDESSSPSPALPPHVEAAAGRLSADPHSAPAPAPRVPPDFITLCSEVVLHQGPERFGLLYRLLWRLMHEPGLRHDALDADVTQARRMAQAVRRDIHKMRAFVRFRPVDDGAGAEPLHVAWFEPEHHIVEANAPFFTRRFTGMRWAVLTPERSMNWDGTTLHFAPGAARTDAPPADAGEALWLTYYQRIFNPARLKVRAMENEMPRRYWRNLPEAALIAPLAAQAHQRRTEMIEQAPTVARRRIVPITPPAETSAAASPDHASIEPTPPGSPERCAGGSASTWQALRERAAGCRECPLGAAATQTVWGEGPVGAAALMLVGEQPGDREDLAGRPFVGPAGQLLARAIGELGWDRSRLYVTNAVKHFKYEPRGKRRIHKTPAQREADACLHWLESEIDTVAPRDIVALGATAARQLMGRPVAVTRERGQWLQRADGRRVLVTLHPSALLRGEPAELEAAFAAWLDDLRKADAAPG